MADTWSRLRTDLKSFEDFPPIVVPSILIKENIQYRIQSKNLLRLESYLQMDLGAFTPEI